ncbi:MAG: endonuclease VII domain-containing protein [Gemmatimonadaceae bacterium]
MIAALYVETGGVYRGPIITRADAKASGLKRFFTGQPCTHGHIAEKNVSSYGCVACALIRTEEFCRQNPDKRREIERKFRKKNAAKIAAQKKEWKAANRDKHRASNRKWRLSKVFASVSMYDRLFAEQGGRCAICLSSKSFSGGGDARAFAVDHCHTSLRVRGLLCGNCNRMLGLVADSPETLRRAASYLEKAR